MLLTAIAAVARNGVIGSGNRIPWHLPADLAFFKRITLGHCIIMGRNSYESIGRPLPGRTNIVVTRDRSYEAADGVVVVHTIEEALAYARATGETEAFIIGGGELYRQTRHLWDRVYRTDVALEPEGDVHFPEMDPRVWSLLWQESHTADERNPCAYTFRLLERVR